MSNLGNFESNLLAPEDIKCEVDIKEEPIECIDGLCDTKDEQIECFDGLCNENDMDYEQNKDLYQGDNRSFDVCSLSSASNSRVENLSPYTDKESEVIGGDGIEASCSQQGKDMEKKFSIIWNFFDIEDDESKAKCKICRKIISRGGQGATRKSFSTSSLRKHAITQHPNEFKKVQEKNETSFKRKFEMQPSTSKRLKTDNMYITLESFKTDITQLTLQQTYDKVKLWDINDERSKRRSFLIGEMMSVDVQPLSIVENIGFQRLMKEISPNYKLPSRKYFQDTIIPQIYNKVRSKIQNLLNQAKYISITTDGWTSNNSNTSFLSITGHWLSNEFVQKTAVIRAVPLQCQNTSSDIKDCILRALDDFNIPLTKIHLVVGDNSTSMASSTRWIGLNYFPCFLNTLQLVLKNAIFDQQYISSLIAICRSIALYFIRSSDAALQLKQFQKELNIPEHKLIQDIETCWTSQYYMLDRINEQKLAIMAYSSQIVSDNKVLHLDSKQWLILNKIVKLLKPFEELTKKLSAQHSLCSTIIPFIAVLKYIFKKVDSDEYFTGLGTCITRWQETCERRLPPYLENTDLIIATFLDPRYKDNFFEENMHNKNQGEELSEKRKIETMLEKIVNWLAKDIEELQQIKDEPKSPPTIDNTTDSSTSGEGNTDLDLTTCFQNVIKKKHKYSDKENEASVLVNATDKLLNNDLKQEVERYMKKSLLPESENPLEWWAKECINFKYLSQAAFKYLSSPSSVESERQFSSEGAICSSKWNRLTADTGEHLMFLHYNLEKVSFEY